MTSTTPWSVNTRDAISPQIAGLDPGPAALVLVENGCGFCEGVSFRRNSLDRLLGVHSVAAAPSCQIIDPPSPLVAVTGPGEVPDLQRHRVHLLAVIPGTSAHITSHRILTCRRWPGTGGVTRCRR